MRPTVYYTDVYITYQVEFSGVQELQWHAGQKLTVEHDGGLLAEFHLDDTVESKSWIILAIGAGFPPVASRHGRARHGLRKIG